MSLIIIGGQNIVRGGSIYRYYILTPGSKYRGGQNIVLHWYICLCYWIQVEEWAPCGLEMWFFLFWRLQGCYTLRSWNMYPCAILTRVCFSLSLYIYTYICIYVYMYIYIWCFMRYWCTPSESVGRGSGCALWCSWMPYFIALVSKWIFRMDVWRMLCSISAITHFHYRDVTWYQAQRSLNQRRFDCLLNCFFRCTSKRHWPLWGKSTGDRWIPLTKLF